MQLRHDSAPQEALCRTRSAEIETHRSAIVRHESAAVLFPNLGRVARAKAAIDRAARARVMLKTAITEAEAYGLHQLLASLADGGEPPVSDGPGAFGADIVAASATSRR
jgi:hypothetical protein